MIGGADGSPTPLTIKAARWLRCSLWCGDEDGCNFWTYIPSEGTCWAKTNAGDTEKKKGYVSGRKDCNSQKQGK